MRHFIIVVHENVPAYIAVETVDGWWARDNLLLNRGHIVLSEVELRLDPDLGPLLDAWEAKDDQAWAEEEAIHEAQMVVDDSQFAEDLATGPPEPAWSEGKSEEEVAAAMTAAQERHYERMGEALEAVARGEAETTRPDLLLYYRLTAGLNLDLDRFTRAHGADRTDPADDAASVARYVAMELLDEYGVRRGVKPL